MQFAIEHLWVPPRPPWLVAYCQNDLNGRSAFDGHHQVYSAASHTPGRTLPFVSILVPTYNEEVNIERCLRDLLASRYPSELMEVLVVDGCSTDGTRKIAEDIASTDPRIRVLENRARLKPAALNLGVSLAKGEVIMRADAHACYPPEYVPILVEGLDEYNADNTGALRRTHLPEELLPRALAVLVDSKFAAGNARYRTGVSAAREVDTVFGGCYRREVFDRIGAFDDKLLRCQDRDFNTRLRASGGRIFLLPQVSCTYFARARLDSYMRWQMEGGDWVFRAGFITGRSLVQWRNYVPFGFTVYLAALPFLRALPLESRVKRAAKVPLATYVALATFESLRLARRHGGALLGPVLVVLFPVNHIAYGLGTIRALWWRLRHDNRQA